MSIAPSHECLSGEFLAVTLAHSLEAIPEPDQSSFLLLEKPKKASKKPSVASRCQKATFPEVRQRSCPYRKSFINQTIRPEGSRPFKFLCQPFFLEFRDPERPKGIPGKNSGAALFDPPAHSNEEECSLPFALRRCDEENATLADQCQKLRFESALTDDKPVPLHDDLAQSNMETELGE
jgi:hypothetical protein